MTEALEITKEELETNKDDYLDRVEKGEIIFVRHPDGRAVLAIPEQWDEDLINLWNHDDAS